MPLALICEWPQKAGSGVAIARAGMHVGYEHGEAENELVSIQKSIAEAVERVNFKVLKPTSFGTPNSNGWAAHLTPEKTRASALKELLERDAVVVHWLTQTPMREIAPESFPSWLSKWAKTELVQGARYNRLRLLISDRGYVPTVTVLLQDSKGFAILSSGDAGPFNHIEFYGSQELVPHWNFGEETHFFTP